MPERDRVPRAPAGAPEDPAAPGDRVGPGPAGALTGPAQRLPAEAGPKDRPDEDVEEALLRWMAQWSVMG